jgi:hypothetical protein
MKPAEISIKIARKTRKETQRRQNIFRRERDPQNSPQKGKMNMKSQISSKIH